MQCPKCQFEQNDSNQECQKCGVIFAKFKERQRQIDGHVKSIMYSQNVEKHEKNQLSSLLFQTPANVNYVSLGGRVLVYIVVLIWGMRFIFSSIDDNYAGHSFMHLINLPIHEAGHIFFRPFGSFVTSLGGSLGQMLVPLICFSVLLIKTRDAFGASVCLWWFGQNFFDLAPYINDARSGTLPLLGGNFGHTSPYGFHDWEYLLNETGLLRYDHLIAKLATVSGTVVMLLSFIWGGYLLFMQYKKCQ